MRFISCIINLVSDFKELLSLGHYTLAAVGPVPYQENLNSM